MKTSHWLRLRIVIDLFLALTILVVVTPFLAAAAVITRTESGSPVFIRLQRVGRGGRPFDMLKIRTMRPVVLDTNSPLTIEGDRRVTRTGRWLRRVRIDEIPQLVHVLAGQMALVGPRPEAPQLVDLRLPEWHHVLSARPGIAGLTQIVVSDWEPRILAASPDPIDAYRSTILPVKLEIDSWYVAHASPTIDLVILCALIQRIFLRRTRTLAHSVLHKRLPVVQRVLESDICAGRDRA